MKEFMIDINNILKIRSLVNISSKYDFDIELSADDFSVSAKSIIGIFTLDITKPVKVTVYSDNVDNYEQYVSEIKDFILPLQTKAV
ncbi:MAG: HPr family phosphocarrier protein [Oscillospiraceae bacterium]|nr:HPr family phosphocarrier protein [Oscillospiraceae bacterium]